MDVVRKITIFARESGYRVETSDIAIEPFLPAELFEGSTEAFMEALPQLDAAFERERQRLVAEGKCWRYVAEWKDGKGSVGLREHPDDHPRLRCRCRRHRRRCLCRRDARGEYMMPRFEEKHEIWA